MSHVIPIVGFDPSFRHWGLAKGTYCLSTDQLTLTGIDVIEPVITTKKQVRVNSKDLESAAQLTKRALEFTQGAKATFVEIPGGSQSASGAKGYGVCIGILGAFRVGGIPFYEITPTEVKLAATNNPNASKTDMLDWAVNTYPDLAWPRYKKNGETLINKGKAEHMADAIATIHAGIASQEFQQFVRLLKAA